MILGALIGNPLSHISHLSGSHASLAHAIDYNAMKKVIWLAKKFIYRHVAVGHIAIPDSQLNYVAITISNLVMCP